MYFRIISMNDYDPRLEKAVMQCASSEWQILIIHFCRRASSLEVLNQIPNDIWDEIFKRALPARISIEFDMSPRLWKKSRLWIHQDGLFMSGFIFWTDRDQEHSEQAKLSGKCSCTKIPLSGAEQTRYVYLYEHCNTCNFSAVSDK